MTANIHRILVTVSSIAAGFGGIVGLPENGALGIDPQVGAALSLFAAGCAIVATAIRANWTTE